MTKVKFFNDFQGTETNNVFYPAGIHDVPEYVADRVVKDRRAEYVEGRGTASYENTPQIEEAAIAPEPIVGVIVKKNKRGRGE